MRSFLFLVVPASVLFVAGCLTGDGYPKSYADAYCSSLFQCVDNDEIEAWTGYDDVADCSEETEENVRQSAEYRSWQDGECGFDADAAANCQEEVAEVAFESECGSMNILEWSVDIWSDECAEVYCDD